MAAEITHTVLAEKVFKLLFRNKNKRDFFVGNSFPDIRYLGMISRNETHFESASLEQVNKEKNSFWAGMKFHGVVDFIRKKYVFGHPQIKRMTRGFGKNRRVLFHTALKLLEDEFFYLQISQWQEKIDFLEIVLPEELSFGLNKEFILKWHRILQENFSQPPCDKTREDFFSSLGFGKNRIGLINQEVSKLRQKKELFQFSEGFYQDFKDFVEIGSKTFLTIRPTKLRSG